VSAFLDSFYAQWRVRSGVVQVLHEDVDSPPENLLQAIWKYQRLLRDQLRVLDGRPLRILHPGFHNREGGPDFLGAVFQVGDDPLLTGDVEVDVRSSAWHGHGHDRNPAFRNVGLHVIWEGEHPLPEAPPALLLRKFLDAPLGELSLWLGGETAQSFPEEQRGKCCAPMRRLSPEQTLDLLHQAAQVRLRSKAAQFQARARQVGWEQGLWEGMFRALGYKHNVWPMQRLGELRPRWLAIEDSTGSRKSTASVVGGGGLANPPAFTIQARLLGLSGLLPLELTRTETRTDQYLRGLWDHWWRDQGGLSDAILPRALWRLHGLRPANHPHRRLALAAAWASSGNLVSRLERWCAESGTTHLSTASLLEALRVEPDEFWSWHWTLHSPRLPRQQPLIGSTRVTDFAVNVVLPWLWIRAIEGGNKAVRQGLEECYFAWPAAEDNSVLRLARQRLLGGATRGCLRGAASQQGLIQIVRDFCEHSNAICEQCKLPQLVGEFLQGFADQACEGQSKIIGTTPVKAHGLRPNPPA
jgi:hypothetical protein